MIRSTAQNLAARRDAAALLVIQVVAQRDQFTADADRLARARSFDRVADEYERGRPSYPPAAIAWVLGERPLAVVDVGAGTGKLTEALLLAGHRVTAVEPLTKMRAILAARLPAARVLEGTAERLPLGDASVDAVVAGAAFHWFDQDAALAEVVRVLRPPGVLGLLGNAFDTSTGWVASLRAILGPPAIERPGHWPSIARLRELFERVSHEQFPHHQDVDRATVRDLASSRSSLATMGAHERGAVLSRIDELWRDRAELSARELAVLPWLARALRCSGVRAGRRADQPRAWPTVAVAASGVRPLRGEVLRPGQSAAQLVFGGDDAPDALHVAVLVDGRAVGVASVMHERYPRSAAVDAWRIRGMATTPALRGRGIGGALLARCEAHARERGGALLWCNARVGARALYERGGMSVVGERFEIASIGPHYLMCKALQARAGAGTC